MNYLRVNNTRDLSSLHIKFSKVTIFSLLGVVFFYSIILRSFAAAECTFAPEINCPVNVLLEPDSYYVVSGGNTNVNATIDGIFQWGVIVTFFDFSLAPSAKAPVGGGLVNANTGPISSTLNVTAFVENSEGVRDSDSIYINITAAPQVNIEFSFLDKFRQFFGSKISESSNLLALEK